MTIKPLHDRIIVRRLEEGELRVGGIIIPDTAKEKPQRGSVIAVGQGKVTGDGRKLPLDVQTGDSILFGRYAGQEVKVDGEEYLIMKEDDVLAVIEAVSPKKPAVSPTKSKIAKKKKVATKSSTKSRKKTKSR